MKKTYYHFNYAKYSNLIAAFGSGYLINTYNFNFKPVIVNKEELPSGGYNNLYDEKQY